MMWSTEAKARLLTLFGYKVMNICVVHFRILYFFCFLFIPYIFTPYLNFTFAKCGLHVHHVMSHIHHKYVKPVNETSQAPVVVFILSFYSQKLDVGYFAAPQRH